MGKRYSAPDTVPTEGQPTEAESAAAAAAGFQRRHLVPRVVMASRSPLLWSMPVSAAMAHFDLRGEQVEVARRVAMALRPQESQAAQARCRAHRLRDRVVRAEVRYPLVHRRLLGGEAAASVADRYQSRWGVPGVRLTRGRAWQLLEQLRQYAAAVGHSDHPVLALGEVERLAASVTDVTDVDGGA